MTTSSLFICLQVYVLAVPLKGPESFVHKNFDLAFLLLLVTIAAMFVSVISFVLLIVRGGRREMHLMCCSNKTNGSDSTS